MTENYARGFVNYFGLFLGRLAIARDEVKAFDSPHPVPIQPSSGGGMLLINNVGARLALPCGVALPTYAARAGQALPLHYRPHRGKKTITPPSTASLTPGTLRPPPAPFSAI